MKLLKNKNITSLLIIILTLSVSTVFLNAAEIKRTNLDKNDNALVYEILTISNSKKNISKMKQLTVKARALNIDIKGNDKNEIKIITLKKYLSNKDNIENGKVINFQEKNSLHQAGLDDFANFDISINNKEILLDFPKLNDEEIQSVELLLPKNISLDLKIKEGDIKLSKFNSEISIKGKNLNTEFNKLNSVLEVENKVGSFIMNEFEGVLNLNTLSGDLEFNKVNGSINVKSSTGSFDMKELSGNLELITKVSDIKIFDSKDSEIFIDYKSGTLKLEELKNVGIVDITATIGDIIIEKSNIKKLNIVNQGGDITLKDTKARMNINLKAGDIIYESKKLFLDDDSYLAVEYGDIVLDIENTEEYEYYNNIEMKSVDYKKIKNTRDLRNLKIGLKGGESNYLNLSISSGSVVVK